ncbi:hypothetical protein OG21DRAFT_1514168 [Imleria badia]|nr:hypothetical protein OG21DRAFT_1514168 [Imleria badia]
MTTIADLDHVIPEHDEYCLMPHSLRNVLTPPTPRSILLEPASSSNPSSPYSRPRWSPSSDPYRARQSVSSIGSCSTVHTRSPQPIKSILTRHDSGISMATTTLSTRRKRKRSPPSVKFVAAPTVYYPNGVYHNSPPRSPPLPPSERQKPARWFTKWWKRPSAPPRPPISGPYHLSYAASLVDDHISRPKPRPGRLKQLWHRLTSMIG